MAGVVDAFEDGAIVEDRDGKAVELALLFFDRRILRFWRLLSVFLNEMDAFTIFNDLGLELTVLIPESLMPKGPSIHARKGVLVKNALNRHVPLPALLHIQQLLMTFDADLLRRVGLLLDG